jgi:hypothetical protein
MPETCIVWIDKHFFTIEDKKSCSTISELISGSQKHETVPNRQFSKVLAFGKFFTIS